MAHRELEWSGTAAEPNRKCANLRMCVDFWDTPVQMCLQRRGFQSALLWWSQTFLLDLISEILDSMPLQMRSLDISYNQSFIQQPARTTVIRVLTLNLKFASGSCTVQPQAVTAGHHRNQQFHGQRQLDYRFWENSSFFFFFANHWPAHYSNLKDPKWFLATIVSCFEICKQRLL